MFCNICVFKSFSQVDVVVQMVNTCRLMRCYFKGTSSSTLIQFSTSFEDNQSEDAGDGGGISVFTSLTIPCFGAYEVSKTSLIRLALLSS